jgi:hypothetical protein
MKLSESEENKIDFIANVASRASYALVIMTTLAIPVLIFLMFFIEYRDSEVLAWCEEYHPTWTYEQCENMTGY